MLKRWRIAHEAAGTAVAVVDLDIDVSDSQYQFRVPTPGSWVIAMATSQLVEFTRELTLAGSLKLRPQTQLALGTWRHRLQP